MKHKYIIAIIPLILSSCLVTQREDGSKTSSVDAPALVTVVDLYFKVKNDNKPINEK